MKKLVIIILALLFTTPILAVDQADQNREVLPDFSENSVPALNNQLNNIWDTINRLSFVDLTSAQTVAGVKTFSSFPITPSSAPTTNYQAANKKYVDDQIAGISSTGYSNVIFQWVGRDGSGSDYGLYHQNYGAAAAYLDKEYFINNGGTPQNYTSCFGDTYNTTSAYPIFIKIAGVNTITCWVCMKTASAGNGTAPICQFTAGGQSVVITGTVNQNAWTWYSGTINVSGLTNGTKYAITIDCKSSNSSETWSAVAFYMFGS